MFDINKKSYHFVLWGTVVQSEIAKWDGMIIVQYFPKTSVSNTVNQTFFLGHLKTRARPWFSSNRGHLGRMTLPFLQQETLLSQKSTRMAQFLTRSRLTPSIAHFFGAPDCYSYILRDKSWRPFHN